MQILPLIGICSCLRCPESVSLFISMNSLFILVRILILIFAYSFGELMKMIDPGLKPVGKYFFDTYIGNDWDPPLFPPRVWNVCCRVNNNIPRTSNLIEGWHKRFQHKLGCHRPAMWRFLMELLKEQNRTENTYARIEVNRFPPSKRKKYAILDKRLKNTYSKFRKMDSILDKHLTACLIYFSMFLYVRDFSENKSDFDNLYFM